MHFMDKIRTVYKGLYDDDARFQLMDKLGLCDNMDDYEYLKKKYKQIMGKELDLENPKTFNEKLQWLKLYDRNPEYTIMVDKYLVKEYVANIIGKEYIIPTLGVWDKAEDIDFEKLPNKFVLKCNHNSGLGMCICKDKSKLDISRTRALLNKGLAQNYYLHGREWPYKDVIRRIIAEEYIEDGIGKSTLDDYKILCFNGEPKIIELHRGRFTSNHTQDFYDVKWNKLNLSQPDMCNSNLTIEKPLLLDKMIELSTVLCAGIPHVRVDWYIANGRLFFGELTFFDGSGFERFCDDGDLKIGKLLILPERYI